jgi:centriolar protein POC1
MDATIKVWDLKMGQILYTLYGHDGPATAVAFSQNGDFFCSGGVDAMLMIWKSNVRNMDEEFESLSKTEMSKMKANRRKLEEDIAGIPEKSQTKVGQIGKTTSQNKFKVTQEKPSQNIGIGNNLTQSQQFQPQQLQTSSNNMFNKLPEELSSTFEKMISQLDIIAKTMKIMDQRIQTVENQVSDIFKSRRSNRGPQEEQGRTGFNNNTYQNQQYNEVELYNQEQMRNKYQVLSYI